MWKIGMWATLNSSSMGAKALLYVWGLVSKDMAVVLVAVAGWVGGGENKATMNCKYTGTTNNQQ